jgi:O-antigen/teichoic acid export membrane protein
MCGAALRPDDPAEPIDSRLDLTVSRGLLWMGGGQFARQVIQLVASLILVRLLGPGEFGLVAMAMFFVGIGQLVADFGLGSAIVQSRSRDPLLLSTCFWLNLAVAAIAALALLAGAPLIARWYGRADVTWVVVFLTTNLVLGALQTIPGATLARDLRFFDVARAQVIGSATGAAGAIGLALAGAGIWALVAQPLLASAVTALCLFLASRWFPGRCFSWSAVSPVARFSANLFGSNLANYGIRNMDALLVGRVLGAAALGYYGMAVQLMLYPLQHVSGVFVRVLFPALSQIRDDLPRLRSVYLKTAGCVALLTFPIMGGLYALTADFVSVVFGVAWAPMTPVLEVLAWVGMMQSVGTLTGTLYMTMGRTDVALRVTLIAAPILAVSMAIGLQWGILGVAVGYAFASYSLFVYTLMTAFRLVGLRLRDFALALCRPLLCTLAMVAVILLAREVVVIDSAALRLGFGVLLGVVCYAAFSLLANRAQVLEISRLLAASTRRR